MFAMLSITTLTTLTSFLLTFHVHAHPTSHPARAVTSKSKAGLAWGGGNVDMSQYTSTGKVSWYYTWNPNPVSQNYLEYVPMLWGNAQLAQFTSTIQQTITDKQITAVLSMNEPEQAAQSNMNPQQGAQMWTTYLEPLKARGVRLGSPATSSAPSGKVWVQDFLTACNGTCTVDFIAMHWYGVNATEFQLYVEDFWNTFQKPLWITEWACENYVDLKAQCSKDDVVLFLNQTQTFLDSASYVERYAWFGAMENLGGVNEYDALMDSSGKITDLGKQYSGAQAPDISGGGGVTASSAMSKHGRSSSLVIFSVAAAVTGLSLLW